MKFPRAAGVLGGMGPAATLDFLSRVLRASGASCDRDHLRLMIDSNPAIPDRTAAIAGTGPSAGPVLARMAAALEKAGAEFLVMPCSTAHAFREDIKAAVSIPFVDMIEETATALRRCHPAAKRAGILATAGCIDARLYPKALSRVNVEAISPAEGLLDDFMGLLHRIKAGDVGAGVRRRMRDIAIALAIQGAEVIVAACTEVPLVLEGGDIDRPLIVSTDILVERTLAHARGTPRSNGDALATGNQDDFSLVGAFSGAHSDKSGRLP